MGRQVRFLDRFFDLYVMGNMQRPVSDIIRPEGANRDPYGVQKSRKDLLTAYDWLEANLGDGPWAAGDSFTMADCAAAPSLFYADWVEEIGPDRPRLSAYRSRLLAHPVVARAVDEGRPYRHYFPLGAPDRD
ncbi:glutathione S-transferase family protein [Sphingomonas daechungensis]|uniref:glutathione S-transferase family protein n=1 Tax=Sphingomonas daechungensis TaxID=1176646 RepID=UPI001CB92429|nr:glutathione S-transferase family protein [Sphingomonas daechungensis]